MTALCPGLWAQINRDDSLQWHLQHTADQKVALVISKNDILPLRDYRNKRQINIFTGDDLHKDSILDIWNCYSRSDYLLMSSRPDFREILRLSDTLLSYDIAVLHLTPQDEKITPQLLSILEILEEIPEILIVVLYTEAPWLQKMISPEKASAIIIAHHPSSRYAIAATKGIFGGIPFTGTLSDLPTLSTNQTRIHFCSSLESGISPKAFLPIDSIVTDAIQKRAFPGCQIIAIWKGNVIFEKCYGHHTYDQQDTVLSNHLYDLASLTKILATTPALIQLDKQGVIDVNESLGQYLQISQETDMGNLSIKAILSHRARLPAWIPFYKQYFSDQTTDTLLFSDKSSILYPWKIYDDLYAHQTLPDSLLDQIIHTRLRKRHGYLYSDLGMIMLKYAIEETTKTPFEEYLDHNIYTPINLYTMGYNPSQTFPKNMIVPTEKDSYFRKGLLQGYVHDPAAAMMGGTAGHAGLFATSRDVAVLMYTLSHQGTYGGIDVFDRETIQKFNHRHYYRLRRGLGFDKPELNKGYKPNVTSLASPESFGHSGFTGTFAWADPEHDLVYVFLSNRLAPEGDPTLLTRMGIRKKIHETLYRIILEAENQSGTTEPVP